MARGNDFVRFCMKCVAFYQYLKGDQIRTCLSKEELKLCIPQKASMQTRGSKSLQEALAKMPGGEEFSSRMPHIKGKEVILSLKQKANVSITSKYNSHRPDKIRISRPGVQTRCARIDPVDLSSSPIDLQDYPRPSINPEERQEAVANSPTQEKHHVTAVQESVCKEMSGTSRAFPIFCEGVFCWAHYHQEEVRRWDHTRQKVHCCSYVLTPDGQIQKGKKGSHAICLLQQRHCKCVKGTGRKWVASRPEVPDIWPVKKSTNLMHKEILALENVGFPFLHHEAISSRRLI